MDLSSLSPQATEWVEPVSQPKDNPAVQWLKDAAAKNHAPQQLSSLSPEVARKVVNMLVKGAVDANVGVSIRIVVNGQEFATSKELWETLLKENVPSVNVKFKTKTRTVRTRKAAVPTVTTGNKPVEGDTLTAPAPKENPTPAAPNTSNKPPTPPKK